MTRTAVAASAKTHGRQIFGTFLYIHYTYIIYIVSPVKLCVCAFV